jgi:siroheme synthase
MNQEPDEIDDEEYEEQIEQMLIENGMMIHTVVNLLTRKGILKQEEIESEMERLYEEMEKASEEGE